MTHSTEEPLRPWLVLTGLALGVCVTNGFARFAYGLILPAMKDDLSWSYAQAGWLNTANALGYIAGAVLTMVLIARISPSRLFSAGLVATTLCLLATGLHEALWWQTLWRGLTGLFGALSFSTAGALTARLFTDNPRRNALAIAILFGSGGGMGIVLAGAALPPMIEVWGNGSWPWAWVLVGGASLTFLPLGLWSARVLRAPVQRGAVAAPLPLRRIWPEIGGYAGFGLGYIVYLTFLSAWMGEQAMSALQIALVWVLLGLCISLSPLVWRGIFARHASGVPLAMVLTGIAVGSALPVLVPTLAGLVLSALVFGLSVFMAPGAVTHFTRQNLPPESWARAISLFTVVFSVAQTVGPYGAGLLGDMAGSIGVSLLVAAGILICGALVALLQRPLEL
ncbi:Predicted arabinose efflux permease, MFS family [Salinihabitans flavidus]|uniref:Predicted arabinose efflux permease, MFS family n=1 Tax=Salinihabitans flavidus TaxID=569882 RepID=A0A1H8S9Z0_9RHOB|nr:YbfB/YjiJ family MFS transporter [Salinihabitans flavidus]SEO75481.1 Predicted arabinose efflux permease, MFS family [Salinihabitans flavidus]